MIFKDIKFKFIPLQKIKNEDIYSKVLFESLINNDLIPIGLLDKRFEKNIQGLNELKNSFDDNNDFHIIIAVTYQKELYYA